MNWRKRPGRRSTTKMGFLIPVLLASSLVIFAMGRLAPGDPVEIPLGEQDATPQMIERVRKHYGLDQPVAVQYFYWLKNAVKGDLGFSYFQSDRKFIEIIT